MKMKKVCKLTYHYGYKMALVPPILFRSPRWGVTDPRAHAWKIEGLRKGIPIQAAFAGKFRDTDIMKSSANIIQKIFRKYKKNN